MKYQATMMNGGRVTIPSEIRKQLGLRAKDKITITVMPDGSMVLRPKTRSFLELQGMLKAKPETHVTVDDMSLGSV